MVVCTEEGTMFYFRMAADTQKTQLMSAVNLIKLFDKDEEGWHERSARK